MDEFKNPAPEGVEVMEEKEYMDYIAKQTKRTGETAPVAQISLYDMNKGLVNTLKKMNNMDVNRALEKVKNWFINHGYYEHYALLNHEKHYFTIFESIGNWQEDDAEQRANNFIKQLKNILTNYYGDNDLRAIDVVTDNSAIEIWGMWNKEPSVAYLFPYDEGVVEF